RIGLHRLSARAAWSAGGAAPPRPIDADRRVVRPLPGAVRCIDCPAAVMPANPLQQALEATEARLRHIVEHAQDLIYYCDTGGPVTYVNRAAARVMKYEERELLGRHFLTLIRPDFQAAAGELYERQLTQQIPNTYFEFPAVTKAGDIVWIGQHVQLV